MTTAVAPGTSFGRERLIAWYGVRPAVGEGHGLDRVEVSERHQVARVVDDHVLGHGAGRAESRRVDAELLGAQAVVLLALGALDARAAAPGAVDRDRVADGESVDPVAECGDGPDPLVSEGERQRERQLFCGPAHHRDVRVADTCGGDLQQNLAGAGFRVRHGDDLRRGAYGAVLNGFHGSSLTSAVLFLTPEAPVRHSGGGVSAVHQVVAAVDERGAVGEQEGGELRHLLRGAETAGRVQRDEVVAGGAVRVAQQRGVDEAGADRVDADVLCRVFKCRRLGEADDSVLGGDVRG